MQSYFDLVFDLMEEGDTLILEVAVPGVLESDIDITLEGFQLIIRAERPPAHGLFIQSEIKRGVLIRDISLPWAVELLESRLEEGVLQLTMRRLEVR